MPEILMSPLVQVTKISDEGSSSPFTALIFFGLLRFRDQLYLLAIEEHEQPKARDHFDWQFKPMLEAAQAARDAAIEIQRLVDTHLEQVRNGEVIRFGANQYNVLQTINIPLSQEVDKLIDQGVVSVKSGLQTVLRDPLGLDISSLFQKDASFEAGMANFQETGEAQLAKYLRDVRDHWLSAFLQLRVDHEHQGWSLGSVQYEITLPSSVAMTMPLVLGQPVDKFAVLIANRILLFIENMIVYAMQRRCPYPIFVTEIPRKQRDPKDPQRFRLAPRGLDPSPPWEISYTDDRDFF